MAQLALGMQHAPVLLAALYFLQMATKRVEERKLRDRQARHAAIIIAARKLAEHQGWSNVTVRRLADEISYSQPVLYSHFQNRDAIIAAVAVEGFQELGGALEEARQQVKRGNGIEAVANAYLHFAATSPTLYEAMFSLSLIVSFGDTDTPPELKYAFSQLLQLFLGESARSEVLSEALWASLHGIAVLTSAKRLPIKRERERVGVLVELFSFAVENLAKPIKSRTGKSAPRS